MSVHVERVGKGPPLALLHGWGLNSRVWGTCTDALASKHELLLVDLPGAGKSAMLPATTLDTLAAAVDRAIPHEAHVLGWSLGGLVALQLALDRPTRSGKWALVCTSPCFVTRAGWPHGIAPKHLSAFGEQLRHDYAATLLDFLVLNLLGAKHARETVRQLRDNVLMHGKPELTALDAKLAVIKRTDLRQRVSEIARDVLVIAGDRDRLAPAGASQWLARHLPRAELTVLERCAHVPFLTHADAFARRVLAFLA